MNSIHPVESPVEEPSPDCIAYRLGKCATNNCGRCNEIRLLWGAIAIALYALGTAFVGFGVSTALFLVTWLLLSTSRIVPSHAKLARVDRR